MRKLVFTIFFISCAILLYANDIQTFIQTQETGNTIKYRIDEDSEGEYLTATDFTTINDTIDIPETVEYNGRLYYVKNIAPESAFLVNLTYRVMYLPKTIVYWQPSLLTILSGQATTHIHVAEGNPRFVSYDGVVYSHDLDTLFSLPSGRRGRYDMIDGVKIIEEGAIFLSCLDTINFAESVEVIKQYGLDLLPYCRSFRYPNSVRRIEYGIVSGENLEKFIFGSGMQYISGSSISAGTFTALSSIYCLAPTPPDLNAYIRGSELLTLFVPRASINLYEAHPAWGLFPRITSIEPPIVSGINEAEVTWVSNADATGYSWELYLDEERTVLVMRLTFNRIGQLSRLEFGSGFMTSSSPAPMHAAAEDEEHSEETTERQFTTYFSFTVENLSPNTQYYYTRKTYGETGEDGEPVVIDEEQSDFTTLSDTPTSLSSAADAPAVQKVLRNGSVYILNGDETYTLTGAEVK